MGKWTGRENRRLVDVSLGMPLKAFRCARVKASAWRQNSPRFPDKPEGQRGERLWPVSCLRTGVAGGCEFCRDAQIGRSKPRSVRWDPPLPPASNPLDIIARRASCTAAVAVSEPLRLSGSTTLGGQPRRAWCKTFSALTCFRPAIRIRRAFADAPRRSAALRHAGPRCG